MAIFERQPVNHPLREGSRTYYPGAQNTFLDRNNNKHRIIYDSEELEYRRLGNSFMDPPFFLPPVCSFFVFLQIFLYWLSLSYNFSEEDVQVDYHSVIEKREYWRLLVAQYFHFNKMTLFLNLITLVSLGRYLEKKILAPAMILIIVMMGTVSNFIYVFTSELLCGERYRNYTYGSSNLMYGLRVFLSYVQEPRNLEPSLIFGIYPVILSTTWAPWQSVLEIIVAKFTVPEVDITGSVCGVVSGFLVSYACIGIFLESLYKRRGSSPFPPFNILYWNRMKERSLQVDANASTRRISSRAT